MATWRDVVTDAAAVSDRFLAAGGSIYDLRDRLARQYPTLSSRDLDQLSSVLSRGREAGRDADFSGPGDRLRVSALPSIASKGQQAPGTTCAYVVYARGTWTDASGQPTWGSVIELPYDKPPTLAQIAADVQAAQEVMTGRTGDTLPSAMRDVAVFSGVEIRQAYKCR